jgi:thioredoxin-related protein
MNKAISIIFLFILSCNSNKTGSINWTEGFPEDFSKSEKITLVDFYADPCTPCERMFNDTYSDPEIVNFCKENFHCFKLMTWAEENKTFQQRYRVYEVPSVIFFNSRGEEIDRLTGFVPPGYFEKEIMRISQGIDTYLYFKNKLKDNPDNPELIYQLVIREAKIGRKGDTESQTLWKRLMDTTKPLSVKHEFARLNYYTGILWRDENPDSLIQLLENIEDYDFNLDGYKTIVDYYRYINDPDLENKYYKTYSDGVYEKKVVTEKYLKFLNAYAFRMTEMNTNIPDALEKINFVLSHLPDSLSDYDKADIIYTKAEILLKSGQNAEALALIKQCLELLPDNAYLIERRNNLEKQIADEAV